MAEDDQNEKLQSRSRNEEVLHQQSTNKSGNVESKQAKESKQPEDSNAQPKSGTEPPQESDKEPLRVKRSKTERLKAKIAKQKQKAYNKANPPGGYDATPISPAADGYVVKFTFLRAENLPVADLSTASSDPFIIATLTSTGITPRHKEDPDVRLRTRTVHRSTDPAWNQEWIVAGVPSSGFRLKCRLYDEDSQNADDRLGNVTLIVPSIGENFTKIEDQCFEVKKRMGSWRAYFVQGVQSMCSKDITFSARLYLSVEVLGKSDEPYGRMYTLGPGMWTKHFSPMIGRLAGTKAPEHDADEEECHGHKAEGKRKVEKYDFQANQIQLRGPVPAELYHRFVEFKPFVKGMFDKTGIRGNILNKALHHQHARIYNYSSTTQYGIFETCTEAASLQFLKMAHYDEGSRLFTYVVTLDGLFRFTETGKEFGIDLLSKHTMHADVNVYIACSGEFFIRRLKNPNIDPEDPEQQTHPSEDLEGGPPHGKPPKKPQMYELIIDNDSGTYRPKGELLPKLKEFLEYNFPGLKIIAKPCTDDKLQNMKKQQREAKGREGNQMFVYQGSDDEWDSSDEESMNGREQGKQGKKDRLYAAIEDPEATIKGMIPHSKGHKAKKEREQRETEDDMAELGESSSATEEGSSEAKGASSQSGENNSSGQTDSDQLMSSGQNSSDTKNESGQSSEATAKKLQDQSTSS